MFSHGRMVLVREPFEIAIEQGVRHRDGRCRRPADERHAAAAPKMLDARSSVALQQARLRIFALAAIAAESVLSIFEKQRPDDPRARRDIRVARELLEGKSVSYSAEDDADSDAGDARAAAAYAAASYAAYAARDACIATDDPEDVTCVTSDSAGYATYAGKAAEDAAGTDTNWEAHVLGLRTALAMTTVAGVEFTDSGN